MINHQICKEYPAFTPFEIDETSFFKVIDLYSDIRTMQIREKELQNPNRVIRKRAGDDWF